jgi:steroid 5-alpha reductase family enzyme
MTMLSLFLISLLIAALYFAVVWAISVRIDNYGLLDVAWSYGVLVLAPLGVVFAQSLTPLQWLTVGVGMAWSLRLGTHILVRVLKHHPEEDPRYLTLRMRWPGKWRFLAFFELQAAIAVVFSLPFLVVVLDPAPRVSALSVGGVVVALAALFGEILADRQLARFKRDPASRGEVCQVGLWRYSRHPNYFFESMFWWGIAAAALQAPFGWIALAPPLLMLYFLLRVTGIPLTEAHSLASKGEKYREYQRTTSAFVPWFRRH